MIIPGTIFLERRAVIKPGRHRTLWGFTLDDLRGLAPCDVNSVHWHADFDSALVNERLKFGDSEE